MMISRQFDNKKKQDPANSKISWSDLPEDVVTLIMEQLCYSDQVRCRAVCKSWKSNIYGLKYEDQESPWIFSYRDYKGKGRDNNLCYLYDPSHMREYTIKLNKKYVLLNATVVASNYGWLIFSSPCLLFFYNPFTDKIIDLPELSINSSADKLIFSACPTSPDCVVFVARLQVWQKFCINTCCPGDTTWTVHLFDSFYYGDILGVAYLNGVLYCAFFQGVLFSFKYATKEWKIHHPNNSLLPHISIGRDYILNILSDGKLLLVYIDYARFECGHAFLFDWDRMKWFEVDNFGNKMLFVDTHYSFISSVGEESHELASTIHHCDWCRSAALTRVSTPPQPYGWINQPLDLTNVWVRPPQIR